jgi:hypothetical protein
MHPLRAVLVPSLWISLLALPATATAQADYSADQGLLRATAGFEELLSVVRVSARAAGEVRRKATRDALEAAIPNKKALGELMLAQPAFGYPLGPTVGDLPSTDDRFKAGKGALIHMQDAVMTVSFIESLLAIQTSLDAATNVWSDNDIRNGFDKLENFGTAIGAIVAAVALAKGGDGSGETAGISVGVAGLTKLLSAAFGGQTGGKFEQKAALIELSRHAYDDLLSSTASADALVAKNEAFLKQLQSELASFGDATQDEKVKSEKVVAVLGEVAQFKIVMSQVPDLIANFEILLKRYKDHEEKIGPDFKSKLAMVGERVERAKGYLTGIQNLTKLTVEVERTLQGLPI